MTKKFIVTSLLILFFLPGISSAVNCLDFIGNSTRLCNPTEQFAGNITSGADRVVVAFGWIIGWTVIANLMFAGFRMITSQGNEEQITKAKTTFQWTLSGFVLALFAYILVYAVSDFLGANKPDPGGSKSIDNINPLNSNTFADLLQMMIKNFLNLAGLLALVLIVVSGFRYITAQGNEEQATQAKKGLQWSILGLIVILLAYVIVVATAKLFGADVTTNP